MFPHTRDKPKPSSMLRKCFATKLHLPAKQTFNANQNGLSTLTTKILPLTMYPYTLDVKMASKTPDTSLKKQKNK